MPQATTASEDATSGAQDKAQQVAGQAQEKAQEAKGKAGSKLREQVDQRSTQAGEEVTTTAEDVRSVGRQLREQGKEQPAKLADQAAERAEQVGSYLKESDADRILNDLEEFGRRQPLAVVAAGVAVGFAFSRFLKASSTERYRSSGNGGGPQVHTSPSEGHPAGTGVRSDRDIGGPTAPATTRPGATGGAPGTAPDSGFASHR